jgi:hypothetical protein
MLAVLTTLAPGRPYEFFDNQTAKVRIAVLPIIDVTTRWNSTLVLLAVAYRLQEFPNKWL